MGFLGNRAESAIVSRKKLDSRFLPVEMLIPRSKRWWGSRNRPHHKTRPHREPLPLNVPFPPDAPSPLLPVNFPPTSWSLKD